MAPTPSLLVKYDITDRGATRSVSNRFHFSGGTPADNAHWTTLSDNVVTAMAAALWNGTTIRQTVGYDATSDVGVFSKTYSTNGAIAAGTSNSPAPGFCCALLRWTTDQRTTKNHPIYLFSYVHGVVNNGRVQPDPTKIQANQLTALTTFADTWWNAGFTDGTVVHHRAGPHGAVGIASTVDLYIRDHDLSPR